MVVRTNIFSLNAHRNLKNVGLEQVRSSQRLASGYRINTAADDAAGLAISETMRAQIRGLDQASRNTQDTQALVMTTEGGLQEITNMIQRARELTIQAANDTNVSINRVQIAYEVGNLAMEIGQMQARVQFNTRTTLSMGFAREADGSLPLGGGNNGEGELHFQIGANEGQSLIHDFSNIRDAIQDAGHIVSILAGALGMAINESSLDWVMQGQPTFNRPPLMTNTDLIDLQIPHGQGGANPFYTSWQDALAGSIAGGLPPGNALSIAPGAGAQIGDTNQDWVANTRVISALIEPVQDILDNINVERAQLGALANRLDYTMRSLDVSSENLSDSESRIRNADMAREMMRFTSAQVLQQAGVSMLAQANNMPNNLLQLLN